MQVEFTWPVHARESYGSPLQKALHMSSSGFGSFCKDGSDCFHPIGASTDSLQRREQAQQVRQGGLKEASEPFGGSWSLEAKAVPYRPGVTGSPTAGLALTMLREAGGWLFTSNLRQLSRRESHEEDGRVLLKA